MADPTLQPQPRVIRLCGICRQPGHRRETCVNEMMIDEPRVDRIRLRALATEQRSRARAARAKMDA